MSEAFWGIVVSIILNAGFWYFQRIINSKTIRVERRKTEADTRKQELENIDNINLKYNDLSENYITTTEKVTELTLLINRNTIEIENLKAEISKILEENIILKNKNKSVDVDICELKLENAKLRKESVEQRRIIEYEQEQSLVLKKGIEMLIAQLKTVSLLPIWNPSE